ncbi:MAG: glycosyltransferase family 2 protein [Bdellovibrio sp.]|nr:glycosyltransferase family 2 protein [Bdellovibrio sp.]
MERRLRVSAIIPVFNRPEMIKRSIRSVLTQTCLPDELVVVDDASTDHTCAVVSECFAQNTTKVDCRLIRLRENRGVSHARNVAAHAAFGEWLALLDSDDEWLPQKLQWQKEKWAENPFWPLIHGEEIWIRDGHFINQKKIHKKGGGDQFERSLQLCIISPSAALIKKSVFLELGEFDCDYPVCEDYDLWLKLTSLYEVGFVERPVLKKYGGHEGQLSHAYHSMDYWRIKSQARLYSLRPNLSLEKKLALLNNVITKSDVLLNGIKKRCHPPDEEISSIKAWAIEMRSALGL